MLTKSDQSFFIWALVLAAFLALISLSGGISMPSINVIYLHSVASLLVLALALVRLVVLGFPGRLATLGGLLAAASLGLVLLQLVPLPVSIWSHFPERDLVMRNLALIGQAPAAMPWSLAPEQTRFAALALLPAIAAFCAGLTVKPHHYIIPVGSLLFCALIGVAFSLGQKAGGADSMLYLYAPDPGVGEGTFNNRNFFAAQIYTSIVLLSAVVADMLSRRTWPSIGVVALGLVLTGLFLAGLALTGSRGGLVFSMLAMPLALAVVFFSSFKLTLGKLVLGLVLTVAGLFVVGQSSMSIFSRFASLEVIDQSRVQIAQGTLVMIKRELPFGTGFGSFVPVYQLGETLETLDAPVVNHAHNDWLELALEGGAPAMILELGFVLLLGAALFKVWQRRNAGQYVAYSRAGLFAVILLVVHSLIDFPLRTPALMVVFGMAAALGLGRAGESVRGFSRSRRNADEAPSPETFRRRRASFGATTPPDNIH